MKKQGLSIALVASQGVENTLLESCARLLQLPINEEADNQAEFLLVLSDQRLELRQTGAERPGPVYADFVTGKARHRRHFGGGRNQPLARAVGLKKRRDPSVIDATAGLGRDAFVLASLGCSVRLLERSPVIWALLQDALDRARQDDQVSAIAQRMRLERADSIAYLEALPESDLPDVIYLDPMYPHRQKSALAKKEMRLFRLLAGDDLDADRLLRVALGRASGRVVVKRPSGGEPLDGPTPSMSISSPNTRYDVYLNSGH